MPDPGLQADSVTPIPIPILHGFRDSCTSTQTIAAEGGALSAIWTRGVKAITKMFRDVKCLCLILKHPDTPWYSRIVLSFPIAYVCSPIQIIPNFIPVVGQLDDLFMLWLANKLVLRLVSDKVRRQCREEAGVIEVAASSTSTATTITPAISTHESNFAPILRVAVAVEMSQHLDSEQMAAIVVSDQNQFHATSVAGISA
jgi:uncharacterized membrane protein YkvA (DUF1232 family)